MSTTLDKDAAATYASWFACLADPTRVRVLHAVAAAGYEVPIGELAELVGISQPTCSHHVKKLAEVGFVLLRKEGTATLVRVNDACCVGLPHAADVVMGALAVRPCRPEPPDGVTVRAMRERDWPAVRHIYAQGIATRNATFETRVPPRETLDRKWLPGHRWVAELGGEVAGWAAVSPVSTRTCYAGVGENSLYVGAEFRGKGVGKALIHRQVTAADDGGLWTLQSAIFPENKASIALHRSAGFRTVGIRERIAQLDGVWRDTVLIERRSGAKAAICGPAGC
ncbi:MAG TPA: metalloregulator ArsR/SmtB family transcription factor [Actinophytocola sp.]|uniref:helix-turn-helix domain-containing GNAT family N-acetyltransferase n=1 Tax=Actinophytocola sp. TaxID=1872138 RepID=UPI002DDD7BD9|nr:metalloregulator ArsR/SmtB family transcription factor [Actinophytocola sp.]HEV2780068.1 metalloregulator ArsR/SmtB family transcription factor [Actinophytocola sp.]